MATVLAFDYGERRIGVAVGDQEVGIAHPLLTIDSEKNAERFGAIAGLIAEWHPERLVVGLPVHMDGTPHAMTEQCQRFARRLSGRFGLPVQLVDERLSSAVAASALREAGVRGRQQKPMLDQVAAQQILQTYLENPNHDLT